MPGVLTVVGIPFGNPGDLTPRASATLGSAAFIVCEEAREGRRLLSRLGLSTPLVEHNEHARAGDARAIVLRILEGEDAALVSDCGMPVVADPGADLVRECAEAGIRVTSAPGPTSFMTALALSGFPAGEFVFRGMLSPKADQRKRQIADLRGERRTTIVFDAPYRLTALVADLAAAMPGRPATLSIDLTMKTEMILRGTLEEIDAEVRSRGWKREFVVVLGPKRS